MTSQSCSEWGKEKQNNVGGPLTKMEQRKDFFWMLFLFSGARWRGRTKVFCHRIPRKSSLEKGFLCLWRDLRGPVANFTAMKARPRKSTRSLWSKHDIAIIVMVARTNVISSWMGKKEISSWRTSREMSRQKIPLISLCSCSLENLSEFWNKAFLGMVSWHPKTRRQVGETSP